MNEHRAKPRILLVDDEPRVTEALQRALRREAYVLLSASSGEAAQETLQRHPIDVVISDEQMPGMSGSQFLSWVREKYPRTIRMILSGQATLDAAVRAINEGEVYRFFLKPCNPTDLVCTIEQALTQKRLEEESRRLLREYRRQAALLAKLGHPGSDLMQLDTDAQGAIVVSESDGETDVKTLLAEMELALQRS
jgi:two-component system probable response regulator PhcQ